MEVLSYDESTGIFKRKKDYGNIKAGSVAGGSHTRGYLVISIFNRKYFAHRLAWFFKHGVFPDGQIDHIDRNKLNNRIDNLRVVTNAENQHNQGIKSNNTSGFQGVTWSAQKKKWHARITIDGRQKHLGFFDSPEAAAEVYRIAKQPMIPAVCS
jgi:hypothetical protein